VLIDDGATGEWMAVMLNGSCSRLVSRDIQSIGQSASQDALPVKHLGGPRGVGMLH
jgi:hypothetical protein